jgi:hypothetical protein
MPQRPREGRLPDGSGVLLVPAAAFAVHQLRYWLAYGSRANAQLAAQGHSYLHSLAPWTVLTLGIGTTLLLRRAARALRTGDAGRVTGRSLLALWATAAAGLLVVYSVQETLESFLVSGHPGGLAGVLGHGGYWAVPAALVVAAGVVALLVAPRAAIVAARHLQRALPRLLPVPVACPAGVPPAVVRPLARAAAGRAPPRSPRS